MSLSVASAVITISDFGKICRICLGQEKLCPIQRTYIRDKKVAELMEYSVMSDVKNEFLPQNICHKCLNDLYKFCKFKKQCEEIEAMLTNLLKSPKSDDIDIDEDIKFDINVIESNITSINETIKLDKEIEDFESKTGLIEDNINCKSDVKDCDKPKEKKVFSRRITLPKKCRKCPYRAKNHEDLQQHRKDNHTMIKCEVCNKVTSRRTYSTHMKYHTKPYKCEICPRTFSSPKDLERHQPTHTGERSYMCFFCGSLFSQISTLHEHEKRVHINKKPAPHVCTFCGKGFSRATPLEIHEKRYHINKMKQPRGNRKRTYLCSDCGKSLSSKSALNLHSRVHTKERPYTCITCGKSFIYSGNLNIHMRHHTGDRPYRCSFCPKAFTSKSVLNQHVRFKHSGEKPFSCSFCGKSFVMKQILKVHMRSHTGERPYTCRICGKDFADNSHLRVHLIMHKKKGITEPAKSEK